MFAKLIGDAFDGGDEDEIDEDEGIYDEGDYEAGDDEALSEEEVDALIQELLESDED